MQRCFEARDQLLERQLGLCRDCPALGRYYSEEHDITVRVFRATCNSTLSMQVQPSYIYILGALTVTTAQRKDTVPHSRVDKEEAAQSGSLITIESGSLSRCYSHGQNENIICMKRFV